jgi:NTP pyrophosphatase (non-canonical NTP hydrolase)
MIDLSKLQKEIWENKKKKGFNVTDVNLEFCYLLDELAEAHQAYLRKRPDIGEELADVAIYLIGLAKMLGVDLEKEIVRKVRKNKKRKYRTVKGVLIRKE